MATGRRDLAVIGGGTAGLSAGLFAARDGIDAVLFESGMIGGQLAVVDRVENFIGFPEPITGYELGPRLFDHATAAGLEVDTREVVGLSFDGADWSLTLSEPGADGDPRVSARAVILATGSRLRRLGVPGEDRYHGSGVSYCATCDGDLFAGRPVAVVGGGDSAVDEALYLAGLAERVTLLNRDPAPGASASTLRRLLSLPNVEMRNGCSVESIEGEEIVTGVVVSSPAGRATLPVDGVFVYAGLSPASGLVGELLALPPDGPVPVDAAMATSLPGLFAAGDVRQHSPHMFATAAGDGVTAARSAARYLRQVPASAAGAA